MHALIEKYGKQTISELLDMVLIVREPTNEWWEEFLKKHEIISRKSRATISGRVRVDRLMGNHERHDGRFIWVEYNPPRVSYIAQARNGRNDLLFNVRIKEDEIQQLMQEISES